MTLPKIFDVAGKQIKVWSHEIEPKALNQLYNTAKLPFVFKHVAAMADCHFGIGATVGSVVATKGAICPACVGVDIGCGMLAIKTDLNYQVCLENVGEIRRSIERSVPLGFNGNKKLSKTVESCLIWTFDGLPSRIQTDTGLLDKAKSQLGSLGGGNHFIELCLDTANNVWVMLHSGSRNIGKTLAEIHINKAKSIMNKMAISLPDPDLAYFVQKTPEYNQYIYDLKWTQAYAAQNRVEMVSRVLKDLSYAVNDKRPVKSVFEINAHHNYVNEEVHFGEIVLVTRKGAIKADKGDYGIIPGSMGAKSYIVEGLGNPESFNSCSHGAGRRMSRGEAKRKFTVEDLVHQTAGVECRKDAGVLDEIPGAYKSIDEVMDNQKDLVSVVAELKQFMCIKG